MEPPSGFEHVTPGLKSTDRIWFDKILKKHESKRSKGYFSREFFQRAFLSESSFPSGFFLDVLTFWYFRWRMLNLVFKKSLDNFFYSRNLQFLSEEIAISRLANPRNEDCKLFWSLCNCLKQGLVN